ncbi:hypothetical protein NT2_07_01940 [Caenibius tardaugens NBRC 16725]|uniref:Uncharacterized protein n=1 Tax=Caenibius tardaugens NBRC 16725 TaxID=1219035 RepID=U2ZXS0_9SPHN|nr:hypothetical protein [Caenibius tardaugens]AZI35532.1 hypothetical protein EGO55_05795 [Caenibius tardaugens NBRC 16725]GAD50194.1 hypothetical protein NT2_07_01940 [Caenibius tardaugens NBRC 16725]
MTNKSLPPEFADLAPFLDWALATADERYAYRRNASRAELKAFYDAILPRTEAILALVDQYPLGALPEELHPLYHLVLSLAEVAPHIELYGGAPGVPYAFDETRFVATHGAQDTALGLSPTAA